jgi:hypothetical protein|tara:strand:- start:626 stop:802 length:177 start_codon:yes stop_codon:yes gene_type:complete
MKVGDLVQVVDNQDGNIDKFGVVTHIIGNDEVEIECLDGPWIYFNSQLEIKNVSKMLK